MIHTSLFNLFQGTTDEPVLGNLQMTEDILYIAETKKKHKVADIVDHSKYANIPHMPRVTDFVSLMLEPICYDILLTDRKFVDNELSKIELQAYAS